MKNNKLDQDFVLNVEFVFLDNRVHHKSYYKKHLNEEELQETGLAKHGVTVDNQQEFDTLDIFDFLLQERFEIKMEEGEMQELRKLCQASKNNTEDIYVAVNKSKKTVKWLPVPFPL